MCHEVFFQVFRINESGAAQTTAERSFSGVYAPDVVMQQSPSLKTLKKVNRESTDHNGYTACTQSYPMAFVTFKTSFLQVNRSVVTVQVGSLGKCCTTGVTLERALPSVNSIMTLFVKIIKN